ncbi:6-hydroxymethylpterin diphosphokinase MptE-like protein [Bdellovibrio bacteriovorus]|nr:6-hydroxymethylpterin diphosphokinase MptE-like protein [Bdellovibrio bacteriovorus]
MIFVLSPARAVVRKNRVYRGKHRGQSCIIFGNGPSLKSFDVGQVKDNVVFVVNYFYKNTILPDIRPDYYALVDELFYGGEIGATQKAIAKYPNCVFLFKSKCLRNPYLRKFVGGAGRSIVTFNQKALIGGDVRYDMTKNFTASINVVNHCIQVALDMGFDRIYLVGCDFNSFTSSKMQHFYDNESDEKSLSLGDELKFYAEVCYHHYALNKIAQEKGIQIINATPGSLLDAYKRSNLP